MVMMATVVVPIVMMPASIVATMMPTVTPVAPMPDGPQRSSREQSDHRKDEACWFDHADSCLQLLAWWIMLPTYTTLA